MPRKMTKQKKNPSQHRKPKRQAPQAETSRNAFDSGQLAETIQNPAYDNLTPDAVQQLQRSHGNQFVNSLTQRQSSPSKPNKIQRLMVTENYFFQNTEGDPAAQLRGDPSYKRLVSNVRMYHLLVANPLDKSNAKVLNEKLDIIYAAIDKLDGPIFRMRRELYKGTLEMVETTRDDVEQERKAINTILTNNAYMNGMMSWKDALFMVRIGETPSSILTEGDLAPGDGDNAPGNPENLTGGMISQVTALDFKNNDGGSDRRVFKPNEVGAESPTSGINSANVQSTFRAMATARVNKLIGAKMQEAGREFKSLVGNFDVAKYKGQMGTVADFAEGKDAAKNVDKDTFYRLNVDIKDITVQQQLANLQLFDMITGQLDRHIGNIMVQQQKGKESKITGIDNDFTFSTDTSLSQNMGRTTMPEKIDRYFAEAILAIDDSEFLAALKGLRSQDKDAALARLKGIKALLQQKLADNELLVAPGDNDYPGAPSWLDVDTETYRTSGFNTGKKDYAMEIYRNHKMAFAAAKKDPSLRPEQDSKGRWVLEYQDGLYLQAREDDGSDLFELVEEAKEERIAENRPNWKGVSQGTQRGGVTIGGRGRQRRGGFTIGNRKK